MNQYPIKLKTDNFFGKCFVCKSGCRRKDKLYQQARHYGYGETEDGLSISFHASCVAEVINNPKCYQNRMIDTALKVCEITQEYKAKKESNTDEEDVFRQEQIAKALALQPIVKSLLDI